MAFRRNLHRALLARLLRVAFLATPALFAPSLPAFAQETDPAPNAGPVPGFTAGLSHVGEVLAALRGGNGMRDLEYLGRLELSGELSTGEAGLWPDGLLFASVQHVYGRGISDERLGALQLVSNIEAPRFTDFAEIWYEQGIPRAGLRLRAGLQDASRSFAAARFGEHFVHSSFGIAPTVFLPAFPEPTLGGAAFLDLRALVRRPDRGSGDEPDDRPRLRAGNGDTADSSLAQRTLGAGVFGSPDGHGAVAVAEIGVGVPFLGHAGDYCLGGWTRLGADPSPAPDHVGSKGIYIVADQPLLVTPGEEQRGLYGFAQFGWGWLDDSDGSGYAAGGLAYHGLLPALGVELPGVGPDLPSASAGVRGLGPDVIGLGLGYARFPALEDGGAVSDREGFAELFYKLGITRWLSAQLLLQRIWQNDGGGATVAGMRLTLDF